VLTTYRFDHPETDASKTLDARAYVYASLFGPVYVLVNGFPVLALLMVPISAGIFIAAFLGFGFVDWFLGSELITIFALIGVPIAALVAQGVAAIELVRVGYLRSGWREGY
jgi:hypothetical protein